MSFSEDIHVSIVCVLFHGAVSICDCADRMEEWLVNNKWERIRKESIVVWGIIRHFAGRTEENHERQPKGQPRIESSISGSTTVTLTSPVRCIGVWVGCSERILIVWQRILQLFNSAFEPMTEEMRRDRKTCKWKASQFVPFTKHY
jgi:hypothetical protein